MIYNGVTVALCYLCACNLDLWWRGMSADLLYLPWTGQPINLVNRTWYAAYTFVAEAFAVEKQFLQQAAFTIHNIEEIGSDFYESMWENWGR